MPKPPNSLKRHLLSPISLLQRMGANATVVLCFRHRMLAKSWTARLARQAGVSSGRKRPVGQRSATVHQSQKQTTWELRHDLAGSISDMNALFGGPYFTKLK